jgi:hypothetical protein
MRFHFLRVAAAVLFLFATNASAQVFGSPEEEQKRYSQMSADIEKIWQATGYLIALRDGRLKDIAPPEKQTDAALEKWQKENSAIETYINIFRGMRDASVTLVNSLALSLHVRERWRPPFHMGLICSHTPIDVLLLTSQKKRGDRSVEKNWAVFGERALSPGEMTKVREGLLVLDRLADAYNDLCTRASNTNNWKN